MSANITKLQTTCMTLHVFNPEHDIALAQNTINFTAPQAAKCLRKDIGFIAALWANDGDYVLVEDTDRAKKAFYQFTCELAEAGIDRTFHGVEFISNDMLHSLQIDNITTWGWDFAVRNELMRNGIDSRLLPEPTEVNIIRQLSHRSTAASVLKSINLPDTVGIAYTCMTEGEAFGHVSDFGAAVLKAPWSCSGRGLRFVSPADITPHIVGWVRNIIKNQGCIIIEPHYDRICDFGMEFRCTEDGKIVYDGLSVFNTEHGSYTGNIIATEHFKESMLIRYVSKQLLDSIKEMIQLKCGEIYSGKYCGPFGVDMMIVRENNTGKCKVHPCVEINLRRTMGHVALSLSQYADNKTKPFFCIEKDKNYQLKLNFI